MVDVHWQVRRGGQSGVRRLLREAAGIGVTFFRFRFFSARGDSRASPHRPREDELAHPADPSRANLAAALGLFLEVAAFQTLTVRLAEGGWRTHLPSQRTLHQWPPNRAVHETVEVLGACHARARAARSAVWTYPPTPVGEAFCGVALGSAGADLGYANISCI